MKVEISYEDAKELRKALNLVIDKMRENNEIEENEDRYYYLDELYNKFSKIEDELEDNLFWQDDDIEV